MKKKKNEKNNIQIGINDLWTTRPDVAELLANEDEGYLYTAYSRHITDFKCKLCGYIIKNKSINVISSSGLSCPCCSDGISYANKFMYNLLTIFINELDYFKNEYSPEWCKFYVNGKLRTGRYDFYFEIKDKKYIVEMDGGLGHGENSPFQITQDESVFIDKEKDRLAAEHDIEVIRIDCYYKNIVKRYDFILKNVLSSRLNNILDLTNVDFNYINNKSLESLLIKTCELWTNKIKVCEIAKELNIARNTVRTYLKIGRSLGLCNYDEYYSAYKSKEKQVYCLNDNIIHDNVQKTATYYNISINQVYKCCSGKTKTGIKDMRGNFIFLFYYDDYLKISQDEIAEKIEYKNSHYKKIVCMNNNYLFDKILDAAIWCNGKPGSIGEVCRNKFSTSGKHPETGEKLKWMFFDDYKNKYDVNQLITEYY